MSEHWRWVAFAPLILLALGIWVFRETRNDVWMQVEQARQSWREGRWERAAEIYQSIYRRYPQGRYAPEVLWELAGIEYFQANQTERAARTYGLLATGYPESPFAREARFRQAEIYVKDLDNLPKAVDLWNSLLADDIDQGLRRRVLFQLAAAHFKSDEFGQALECLPPILGESDDELAQQARVLLGTIHQVQGRYLRSVEVLTDALGREACPDCRLQARLLLIQDYEFLNDLPKAIEIAQAIDNPGFTPQMKSELIRRLEFKQKFDRP